MRTTIDIPGDLLAQAKKLAKLRGATLSDVIESGLRRELDETDTGYVLSGATFTGTGVQAGIVEGDWASRRGAIYRGRGG